MSLFKFTNDTVVRRLRAVMIGAMLFTMVNALAGQPRGFWRDPQTAIRGDGLSIHNVVNHTFDLFLGKGWLPYTLACLAYLALAFITVSILPRKAALIVNLSVIFGHFFAASNWLAVRWHLGFDAVALYGLLTGTGIAAAVSPISSPAGDQTIKRLRWLMIGVMLFDPVVTLLGQPASYWARPETVYEGNPFWRSFMMRGWLSYVLVDLTYCLGAFWLVSSVPKFYAVVGIFAFMFGHFIGASNWLFYVWRLGIEAPIIYGVVLSSIIVFLSFRRSQTSIVIAEGAPFTSRAVPAACS